MQNTAEIVKRMEEVRLMESRKSLRLMDRGDSVAPTGDATATAASTQASTPSTPAADKHNANGIDVPGAYSRYYSIIIYLLFIILIIIYYYLSTIIYYCYLLLKELANFSFAINYY